MEQQVNVIGRKVKRQAYAFASPFARVFYCNDIEFVNNGTSTVTINDVFTLSPGASQSLGCDQNEIDETIYKVSFGSTGVNNLQVWVKENIGQSGIEIPLTSQKANVPDRRIFLKEYANRKRPNSDF